MANLSDLPVEYSSTSVVSPLVVVSLDYSAPAVEVAVVVDVLAVVVVVLSGSFHVHHPWVQCLK